jgi:hypothetical protein
VPHGGEDRHRRPAAALTPAAIDSLIGERLAALNIATWTIDREKDEQTVVRYRGRDPAGYAMDRWFNLSRSEAEDLDEAGRCIGRRLAQQTRVAERVRLEPPVETGTAMTMANLLVNGPLLRRLRLDHGDTAQGVLREAVLHLLQGRGVRMERHPRPYGIVLNSNRLDHREVVSTGVEWKGSALVLNKVSFPQQMLDGMTGRPVRDVLDHELLEGLAVRRASSEESAEHGATTVIETEGPWTWADEV